MHHYLSSTRSAYYGAITALPLLLVYEALLALGGSGPRGQVRNGADVWLRDLLASLEIQPTHATLVMILAVVIAIPLLRRDGITFKPGYALAMFGESLVYSLFLGLVISMVLQFVLFPLTLAMPGALPAMPAAGTALSASDTLLAFPANMGVTQSIALSLGAGLFEEFMFRVLLLGGLLAFTKTFMPVNLAAVFSIVLAALLFAAAHHVGSLGEPFILRVFLFRFVAGLIFTGLYYLRGFGVTALSHALYDIRVIVF